MFTAAKVIQEDFEEGEIAKTDFVNIYITNGLDKYEFNVVLKHEQAHIWLEHNRRLPKEVDFKLWNMACDMEIARNIYTKEDVEIIKRPFSRLSKGILSDTFPELPSNLMYAEEIYEWFKNNPPPTIEISLQDIVDALKNPVSKGKDSSSDKMKKEIVKEIRKKFKKEDLKEIKEKLEKLFSKVADETTVLLISEIKNRIPSLTEEIDSALRNRVDRLRSYRRPSRRTYSNDFLDKGRVTKANPPLVEIFVDRSGSFTPDKTKIAKDKLSNILKKYGASVKHDVWFFGNGKLSSKLSPGGDTPYHLIYRHLLLTKPKIAIVITDDDAVSSHVKEIKNQKILCVPIGCNKTELSKYIGGIDVSL